MAEIIIHIGLPKTATTTIQNHFFYNLPNEKFNYIYEKKVDKRINEDTYSTHYLYNLINQKVDFDYQSKLINDKINILSNELLTVPSFFDHYRKNTMFNNAKLLKDYFGFNHQYKILITLRNQVDWLYSLYVQLYGHSKLKKDLKSQFFNKSEVRKSIKYEANYYNLIQSYIDVFGKDSIEILLFEDFLLDKEIYIEKLSKYLNFDVSHMSDLFKDKHSRIKVKTPKGYKTDNYVAKRYVHLINRLRYRYLWLNRLIEHIKKQPTYQKFRELIIYKQIKKVIPFFRFDQKEIIKKTFAKSNRDLVKEFKLDFEKMNKYGYF